MKTTWILGAGFSRPLGGKLLPDLFDTSCAPLAASAFPGLSHDESEQINATMALYRDHLAIPERVDAVRLWRNAEEFLERLEVAAGQDTTAVENRLISKQLRESLRKHGDEGIRIANSTAKALLAVECHIFLQHANLATERWLPYVMWAESLTPCDTIVTFNYDLVMERLINNGNVLNVCLPAESPATPRTSNLTASSARELGVPEFKLDALKANVLKLHGSVDWHFIERRIQRVPPDGDPSWQYFCKSVIGTPGPDKHELSRERFRGLWEAAMAAIHEAEEVVIIGYRMPESDFNARHEILNAIANRRHENQKIKIVLGPAQQGADAVRLKYLIDTATGRLSSTKGSLGKHGSEAEAVEIVPLYCQDFLPLYARRERGHVARGRDTECPPLR